MDDPILTIDEREAINSGRWFSTLSPSLRHDILRCAYVKRFKDGSLIAARGDPPEEWIACARGAVRVSSTSISGKQITLTYVEPGIWFGDVAIFDGDQFFAFTTLEGACRFVIKEKGTHYGLLMQKGSWTITLTNMSSGSIVEVLDPGAYCFIVCFSKLL